MMSSCVELRRARPLLGTLVEIKATARTEKIAAGAIARAFVAVARVHALMSFHDPASDLSAMNRLAARRAVRVHPWTANVLRRALRLHRESNGAFDLTVARELCAAGLLPQRTRRLGAGGMRSVEIDRTNHVRFTRPSLIDFGGIAKGFAVDRAIAALRAAGAICGLVNAGGDLRTFGAPAEIVRVRAADDPSRVGAVVALRNRALATSAFYFDHERGRGSAIFDGRSRVAVEGEISVSVSAPDCVTADALTKVALLLREQAQPLLARYRAEAFLLGPGNQCRWLHQNHARRSA